MSESKGWIKLHRCLLDKAAWQLCTDGQRVVMITVLLLANHEPKSWVWQGEKYVCQAGQFITSYQSLARACGGTTKTVRGALDKLEKVGFLVTKRAHSGTLITVENWALYQGGDENRAQQRAQEGHDKGTTRAQEGHVEGQLTINKEIKNKEVRNKKNIYGEYKHVLLLPDEYNRLVDEFGQAVTDEAIRVVDEYCESSGKRYKNYNLTLRKWGIKEGKVRVENGVPDGSAGTAKRDFDKRNAELNELLRRSGKRPENDIFE